MAARQVKLQSARLNGIMQRWADTATEESHLCRPVVLFLHGWPGSWFNWRHQLKAVHEAGFRGIAPDMRGYGGTDAPSHMADYNIYSISGDVHALMQHIGVKNAALVGHDHGANAGWKLAALYPQSFGCFCALSVPYGGRSNSPPLSKLRAKFGDERDPNQSPRFHYQLHHQLPEAASHYSVDARSALLALLQHSDTTASAPLVDSPQMYVDGIAEPLWKRLPQPRGPPHWLPEADFEYLLSQYASKGFEGGLNWYRVLDIDWHATPQLASRKLAQPVAFIGGKLDPILSWFGGPLGIQDKLALICDRSFEAHFVDAGHWVQEELPGTVNTLILCFLATHHQNFAREVSISKL